MIKKITRALGKGEVECSIHSGGTIFSNELFILKYRIFAGALWPENDFLFSSGSIPPGRHQDFPDRNTTGAPIPPR